MIIPMLTGVQLLDIMAVYNPEYFRLELTVAKSLFEL